MNNLREWWSDKAHRKDTLILAAIVAIFALTLWLGPIVAGR